MKIKVNKKDIKRGYNNIISINYCGAWYLLSCKEPDFYTCGVYGWNEDIYKIDYNTIITTGYRTIKGLENYELTKKYNDKAKKIYNSDLDYKTINKKINNLLDKYIKEMLKGCN